MQTIAQFKARRTCRVKRQIIAGIVIAVPDRWGPPFVIAGLTRNPGVARHWIPDRVRDDSRFVIAGLTRNPVNACHWIPDRVRDDGRFVIAGLIRNPVNACHWIPDRVRDDNCRVRDDNRDDNRFLSAPTHHVEELTIGLGSAHLLQYHFHGFDFIHVVEELAQDASLLQNFRLQ